MPTYLCHGFRWHRKSIRIFIVIHDIDDGAPEWIIAPASSRAILKTFHRAFDFVPSREPGSRPASGDPSSSKPATGDAGAGEGEEAGGEDEDGEGEAAVSLLEEYDPSDLETVSRPYAYVADYAVKVDASASLSAEMAKYDERVRDACGEWFPKLRDQLQGSEEIGWYVVVCGDEERETGLPPFEPEPEVEDVDEGEGGEEQKGGEGEAVSAGEAVKAVESQPDRLAPETPAPGPGKKKPDKKRSFRRLFGMKGSTG